MEDGRWKMADGRSMDDGAPDVGMRLEWYMAEVLGQWMMDDGSTLYRLNY